MPVPNTLRIGPVRVSPGLLLAPMEDVSDLPFRIVCRELGADLVYTEFVSAEGLVRRGAHGSPRLRRKLAFLAAERPIGIQLYGASGLSMEQAAQQAASLEPDLIDVNCGCWVGKVALQGAGAGLLQDLDQLREVVCRVVRATDLPVTVKTRLGWDRQSIRIVEVARLLEDLGVRALTVHCRTRAQGNKGPVDYSWVPRIKEAVSMPIVVNGGIAGPEDVARAFAHTGCDGVMIARAAIQHPWIFREARQYMETGAWAPPTPQQRAALCLRHLRLAVEHRGERRALISLRRHYAGYFRDLPGAGRLRAELCQYQEIGPLEERLHELCGAALVPAAG